VPSKRHTVDPAPRITMHNRSESNPEGTAFSVGNRDNSIKTQTENLDVASDSFSNFWGGIVLIVILIILIVLFGFGGYRMGPGIGYYGGGTLSLILLIILVLLLLKVI
jgi:hypothetical protein